MAEIDIEKKRKPIWPWLLALLLIAVGVWAVIEFTGSENDQGITGVEVPMGEEQEQEQNQTAAGQGTADVPQEVESYFSFVEDSAEMGLSHEYTSRGLMKLSAALETVVDRYDPENRVSVENAMQQIESKADFIQNDRTSPYHADSIRAAFKVAQNVLQELEEAYPEVEANASDIGEELDQLKRDEVTLEQKSDVKSLFQETKKVIEEVVENAPVKS